MPPFKFFSRQIYGKNKSQQDEDGSPLLLAVDPSLKKTRVKAKIKPRTNRLTMVAKKFFIGPGKREFLCQGKDANNLTLLQALLGGGRKRLKKRAGNSASNSHYWWWPLMQDSSEDESSGKSNGESSGRGIVENLFKNDLTSLLWGLYAYFIHILGKRKDINNMVAQKNKIVGEMDKTTGKLWGVEWAGKEYEKVNAQAKNKAKATDDIIETIAGQRDFAERTDPKKFLINICNLLLPKSSAVSRFDGQMFLMDDLTPFIKIDEKTNERLKEKETNGQEEDMFIIKSSYAVLYHAHSKSFRNSYEPRSGSSSSPSGSLNNLLSSIFQKAVKDTTFSGVVYSPTIIYPRVGNPLYLTDVVVGSSLNGSTKLIHYRHTLRGRKSAIEWFTKNSKEATNIKAYDESVWKRENWINEETRKHDPPINATEILFSFYKP